MEARIIYVAIAKGKLSQQVVAIGKFRSSHLCLGNPWTTPLYQSSSKFGNFLFFFTADTVGHGSRNGGNQFFRRDCEQFQLDYVIFSTVFMFVTENANMWIEHSEA